MNLTRLGAYSREMYFISPPQLHYIPLKGNNLYHNYYTINTSIVTTDNPPNHWHTVGIQMFVNKINLNNVFFFQ